MSENSIDIALVQETYLKPNRPKACSIAGYVQLRTDRTYSSKGGTALYYRRSLHCGPINIPPLTNMEATGCRLAMTGHSTLVIVSVYLPSPKRLLRRDLRALFALGDAVILFGALTNHVRTVVEESEREVPASSDRRKFPPDILELIRAKNAALRRASAYPTPEYRSRARALQREVKARLPKRSKPRIYPIPHSKPDNSEAIDDAEIAECLADSIETQCSHASPPHDIAHISRIEEEVLQKTSLEPKDDLAPVSLSEVQTLVKSLNTRKAPGLDGISNKAIKCFSIPLLSLLVAIFNACIKNCYFPPAWKEAERSPPRKGLIIDEQFGFRPAHSCPQQVLRLVEYVSEGFETERSTVAVFFDVAKAFDRQTDISHLGMSALTRQDVLSEQEFLKAPPSPLLYSAYTNDVPRPSSSGVQLALFADDTALFYGNRNRSTDSPSSPQRAIDELGQWFRKWRIEVNPTNQQPYNSSMDASKRFFDIAGSHPNALLRAAVDYQPPHPTLSVGHETVGLSVSQVIDLSSLLHPAAANRLRPGRRRNRPVTVSCDILCRDDFHQASSIAHVTRRRHSHVPSGRTRLLEEIKKTNTMIVIGETGSGKTTQIPQIIHDAQLAGSGLIGVTQPRRVAAVTIALRVATETNTQVGNLIGYTVRFEDVTSVKTKIKYLTDGMLLREAMIDPLLKKYSVIILDEAHERTVSTDVLFGIVKIAQKERLEKNLLSLKIIVMSATMDVDSFSDYFDKCPVIYLEGRTFPVTIFHSKLKQEDYQYAALCTIFQLHSTLPSDNDFLVFLTGQEEIETLMHNIKQIAKELTGSQMKVFPLYAGLPAAKQLQVWRETPPGTRKVVLATNIAEASVTIPGIKCVIDSGVVKERTWCTRTGAERLTVAACARSACWQRAGRAGRDSPGRVYRLYTAADFKQRPEHQTPEIVRCPLAPTILHLIAIGVNPTTFPLMDAPPEDAIKASLILLKELGSIDNENSPNLTQLGKKMSAFPIDPKYAKVLLNASDYDCLEEALSVVAVLSSENIFHSPMHKREEALKVKQKFVSPHSDHITLLNVFKAFCNAPLKKQWCKENYLHHRNLSYAFDIRQQLLAICQRLNLPIKSCGTAVDQVLKCLLCGLFTNCAWLRNGSSVGGAGGGGSRYVTAAGLAAGLHPSSALASSRPAPPLVLYSELLHTRRPYLLTVSALQPHWLHQIVPDYARRCRHR
ncbi:ATP-dependent RNA helicase DHX33 [Eumeta japonica]|uniref:RNA helicase n=1 Tax=Eumeta variegata TaxID=151549 RepID=A0A4C1TCR1_EUMVA|nr:ATP-dependent RNA helicase DHX33 [Eumeta japonica]